MEEDGPLVATVQEEHVPGIREEAAACPDEGRVAGITDEEVGPDDSLDEAIPMDAAVLIGVAMAGHVRRASGEGEDHEKYCQAFHLNSRNIIKTSSAS
jgi:hypothetical protein